MITLQLYQNDSNNQRVDAEVIRNIISNVIYKNENLELFPEQISDDKNYICYSTLMDDENDNDLSYTIENKSKTLKVFIYDNMFTIEGINSGIVFLKLNTILKNISINSDSNLWIFSIKFPIGEMKDILTEFNIKKDNETNWSGMLHVNEMYSFVEKFRPYFEPRNKNKRSR